MEQPFFFKFKIISKSGTSLDCGATHYLGSIKMEYANAFILGKDSNVLSIMDNEQLTEAKLRGEDAYCYETAPWWNET